MGAHIRDDDVEPLMKAEETAKFLCVSEAQWPICHRGGGVGVGAMIPRRRPMSIRS